jgi:hypothetical protein
MKLLIGLGLPVFYDNRALDWKSGQKLQLTPVEMPNILNIIAAKSLGELSVRKQSRDDWRGFTGCRTGVKRRY